VIADGEGVKQKLARAYAYLDPILKQVERVTIDNPYRVVCQRDGEGFEYVARIDFTEIADLSLDIGDCVHNLRSALDHLAWRLVEISGGTPGSRTVFPICNPAAPPAKGLQISGLNRTTPKGGAIFDTMEAVQPYKTGYRFKDPLWGLRGWSNTDKHRLLLSSLTCIEQPMPYAVQADEPRLLDECYAIRVPLKSGDIFARLAFDGPYPEPGPERYAMLEVTLDQGIRDWGGFPVGYLEVLANYVRDGIVPKFEQFF
jgi:hypothetical protein